MNKSELLAHIAAIETALNEAGIEFLEVNKSATNEELAAEISRLEMLLPADEDKAKDKLSDAKLDEDNKQESELKIKIAKEVNIEIILNGKKVILAGGTSHSLPRDRAISIVSEKLGVLVNANESF